MTQINRRYYAPHQAPPAPYDWRNPANCVGLTKQEIERIFFPTDGSVTPEAKILCSTCLVIKECDAFARSRPERYGIWAGVNREKTGQR